MNSFTGRRDTGAGRLTCCEEWQLVPEPTNRPHLCLTCQCPDSVSANQPINWTQLATPTSSPMQTTFFKGSFLTLPSSHSTSHSVSASYGAGGRHFSVFINVPRPINAVAWRPELVICCLPPSRLSAAAPRHLHRDQNALIQFMQSLFFLNSHFVCSDEGPYCPLGRPSRVRDGGRVGCCWSRSWLTLGSLVFSFVIYSLISLLFEMFRFQFSDPVKIQLLFSSVIGFFCIL